MVARENSKLSVYAYMFGQFDWNVTTLVPSGTKVLANEKLAQISTSTPHRKEEWIAKSSKDHYRYIKVYFPARRDDRDVNTVRFFPETVNIPIEDLEDFLR